MKNIIEFATDLVGDTASLNEHHTEDWGLLAQHAGMTIGWSQDLAGSWADAIYDNDTTVKIMENRDRSDIQQSFAVWYEKLASGAPGEVFWAETALIGLYHAVAGVESRHVVSLAARVEARFYDLCISNLGPGEAQPLFEAFHRVFQLAIALIVDSAEHALMEGMGGIGITDGLVRRIRTVGIRGMVDKARQELPLIAWTDALSVGIKSIDDQHRKLVDLLNSLKEAGNSGQGHAVLKEILGDLVQYTVYHFDYEEELMTKFQYPGYKSHKHAHEVLKKQVGEFNDQFQAGKAKLSADLFKFLRTWLNGHIRGTDRLYSQFLLENGVN